MLSVMSCCVRRHIDAFVLRVTSLGAVRTTDVIRCARIRAVVTNAQARRWLTLTQHGSCPLQCPAALAAPVAPAAKQRQLPKLEDFLRKRDYVGAITLLEVRRMCLPCS
jgi:hypothetical protein